MTDPKQLRAARRLAFSALSVAVATCFLAAPAGSARAQGIGDLIKKKPAKGKGEENAVKPIEVRLPPYHGPKKRLAVSDLEIKIQATTSSEPTSTGGVMTTTTVYVPPPADFGMGLTDMLVTGLAATNRFILLERSDKGLQDITKEQTLQGVDDRTKAQTNKLIGAQVLVRGAVTEYSYKRSSTGGGADILKGIGIGGGKSEASVVIDVKLYDATTGEIYDSQKAEGRAASSGTAVNIDRPDLKFSGSSFQSSPLGAASRSAIEQAIKKICERMDTMPWEGRIADVVTDEGRGAEIYLNIGSRGGIQVGDEFEAFHPGRAIEDPDVPGRIIRRTKGARVGRIKVTTVENDIAIAKPVEGDGFAAKDVIRVVGAVPPGDAPKPPAPTDTAAPKPDPAAGGTPTPAPPQPQPQPDKPAAP